MPRPPMDGLFTREQGEAAIAAGKSMRAFAAELGVSEQRVWRLASKLRLKWRQKTATCVNGHPRRGNVYLRADGRHVCKLCNSERYQEHQQRLRKGPLKHSWMEWMEVSIREANENLPHWVPRKSDAIKAWLIENGIPQN